MAALRDQIPAVSRCRELEASTPQESQPVPPAAAVAHYPLDSAVKQVAGRDIGTEITTLDMSGWALTQVQVREVATVLPNLLRLAVVTCDSTGDPDRRSGGPKPYTLNVEDASIDLSSKSIGSADTILLAAWIQRPEVSAAVTDVDMNDEGVKPKPRGLFARCLCQAPYEKLEGPEDARPHEAMSASAVLASLNLSSNPLTGASRNVSKLGGPWENIDSDMTGFIALCAVLGKLNEVNLSDCHLGPTSTAELAKVFSNARAAIKSLALSGNNIIGLDQYGDGTEDLSGFEQLCAVIGKLHELNL
eukprot:COSAG01_NODE_16768_length_1206_cov_2.324300_1_plen_303_part_10